MRLLALPCIVALALLAPDRASAEKTKVVRLTSLLTAQQRDVLARERARGQRARGNPATNKLLSRFGLHIDDPHVQESFAMYQSGSITQWVGQGSVAGSMMGERGSAATRSRVIRWSPVMRGKKLVGGLWIGTEDSWSWGERPVDGTHYTLDAAIEKFGEPAVRDVVIRIARNKLAASVDDGNLVPKARRALEDKAGTDDLMAKFF
jgi:hypothetical protein